MKCSRNYNVILTRHSQALSRPLCCMPTQWKIQVSAWLIQIRKHNHKIIISEWTVLFLWFYVRLCCFDVILNLQKGWETEKLEMKLIFQNCVFVLSWSETKQVLIHLSLLVFGTVETPTLFVVQRPLECWAFPTPKQQWELSRCFDCFFKVQSSKICSIFRRCRFWSKRSCRASLKTSKLLWFTS